MRIRLAWLVVAVLLVACVAADVDDDDVAVEYQEMPGTLRSVSNPRVEGLGIPYTLDDPIELPSSLVDTFIVDGERKTLHIQIVAPKKTGKYEVEIPRTSSHSVLQAAVQSNAVMRADTSIDGKLTSTFGNFGYNLNLALTRGSHKIIFFVTDAERVRDFYRAHKGQDVSRHPDLPVIDMEILLSSDAEDVERVQAIIESMVTTEVNTMT